MSQRVIVFGPTGMLGRYVVKYLDKMGFDVVPIDRERHDILADGTSRLWNLFESKYQLDANDNDVVINCAGLIKQRNNFTKKELIEVNCMFPHDLAMMSKECGFKVIHITTDCVFSGIKKYGMGGYDENDAHDALDDYGKSKSLGESPLNCNIRTSIIGEELTNKLSLLEWAKSQAGKKVTGYNDIWNGVTCLQLAKYMTYLIDNDLFWEGTRHYFTNVDQHDDWYQETERVVERISKYGLLKEINHVYNLSLDVQPVLDIRNVGLRRDLDTIYPLEELLPTGTFQQQLEELRDFKLE